MIIDNIENLKIYKNIPNDVIDFLSRLNLSDIELGKKVLSDNVYLNIEEYNTKLLENAKFESHDKYIDIQLLLNGMEEIYYTSRFGLNVNIPYNEESDITFYSDPVKKFPSVKLDGSNFMMIFPHEAHAPQVSIDENIQKVLKVVVKIKV